jgi:hypothetical protein
LITSTGDPAPSLHPHYRASSLLRAGPPAHPATRTASCLTSCNPPPVVSMERLLTFRSGAADQVHVASMPDTAWPIGGHPPGSSRSTRPNTPVLMPSVFVTTRPQRFTCARLPDPYLTPHRMPFPRTLTTTVFSQRSTRRFGASPRRTAPKGQFLHLPNSIINHESPPTALLRRHAGWVGVRARSLW